MCTEGGGCESAAWGLAEPLTPLVPGSEVPRLLLGHPSSEVLWLLGPLKKFESFGVNFGGMLHSCGGKHSWFQAPNLPLSPQLTG